MPVDGRPAATALLARASNSYVTAPQPYMGTPQELFLTLEPAQCRSNVNNNSNCYFYRTSTSNSILRDQSCKILHVSRITSPFTGVRDSSVPPLHL
jgi:hypothetical protein